MEDQARMKHMEAATAITTTTITNRISSRRITTQQRSRNINSTMQAPMSTAMAMAVSIAGFEQRRTDMSDSDTCGKQQNYKV